MPDSSQQHFWELKTLSEMTQEEWESVCDGCGKCCLHKLEDEEDGQVYYTDVACQYLDVTSCRCQQYARRKQLVPDCMTLKPEDIAEFSWLPASCAYRLLSEGSPLPIWHPLVSKNDQSVHKAGVSVCDKVISERDVSENDYQERVIHWID